MRTVLYYLKLILEYLRETQKYFHGTCLLAENRTQDLAKMKQVANFSGHKPSISVEEVNTATVSL